MYRANVILKKYITLILTFFMDETDISLRVAKLWKGLKAKLKQKSQKQGKY